MVRLVGTISRLNRSKILVAGDLMLDTYTIGKVRRISPEAPVAVVHVLSEENRPGGAGNVMLNLISMGAQVVALGRIGEDVAGEQLRNALIAEKVDVSGLVVQSNASTPVKNRIIADNQQIVRVDYEQSTTIPEMLEQSVIDMLPQLLEGVALVAISDYGKGFLSRTLLNALIENARARRIPVIADPKGADFSKYNGATVIKPNLSEAYAAAGLPLDASLDHVAEKILLKAQAQMLMITRSEAGISLFQSNGQRQDFSVKAREVKDVTGAGDTVLAMLACGMASGLSIEESIQLSNVAAGLAIEKFGCARIALPELTRHLLERDVINKIFYEEHLTALHEVLKGRKYCLLSLSSAEGLTSAVFACIRQLGHNPECDLIIYIQDAQPDDGFISLLASLHDVKFILIQSENLNRLCKMIQPSEIYAIQGKSLVQLDSLSCLLDFEPVH